MSAPALVLFDIDGTLIRRAGPHHREALSTAIRNITGLETTTEGIPVQGMLDGDILREMLVRAGAKPGLIRARMPDVFAEAQRVYEQTCPVLERRVCPGVRVSLRRLAQAGAVLGLVTGNLSAIAWRKMERAGLRDFFEFGAFAEMGRTRADLVRLAIRQAKRERRINGKARITLVGDHPNDIRAAKLNGIQSVAVATGVVGAEELRMHSPDLLLSDLRSLRPQMVLP